MELPQIEEINPLGLPVEKQFNNAYINADFKNRNLGAKAQLLADGQVKVLQKNEIVVPNILPSAENLDDWKQQSILFGQQLKSSKEQYSKMHKYEEQQDYSNRITVGEQDKYELTSRSGVLPRLQSDFVLKIPAKRGNELAFNAQNNQGDQGRQHQAHLQKSKINPLQQASFQKAATTAGSIKKQSTVKSQQVQGTQQLQLQQTTTVKATEEDKQSDDQAPIGDGKIRKRSKNKKTWNEESEWSQNPIDYFKQNQPRRFDNIRLFKLNRAHLTKNISVDQSALSEANLEEDSDDELVKGMISEEKLKQNKKASVKIQELRRQRAAQKRQQELLNRNKHSFIQTPYKEDLRAILKNNSDQFSIFESRTEKKSQRLSQFVQLQDDWHDLGKTADLALKNACSALNPRFEAAGYAPHLNRVLKADYVPANAKSNLRAQMVEKAGMRERVAELKEEIGILAYMRRNGLEKQSNYFNSQETIKDFKQETQYHPQLLETQVGQTQQAFNNANFDSSSDNSLTRLSQRSKDKQLVQSEQLIDTVAQLKKSASPIKTLISENVLKTQAHGTSSVHTGLITQKGSQAGFENQSQLQSGKVLTTYLDSDFWFHKGVVLNQKDENESAVQCYQQALKINENHLPSIFNLACNLEKLKQYSEAQYWFNHAIEVQPDWADALYGLTLVSLRLKEPAKAVSYIERAYRLQGENATEHIKYALALSYRANYDWDNAMVSYRPIMKNETTILKYRDMVNSQNQKMMENNIAEDIGSLKFNVDLYSHFKENGLVRKNYYDVDLWPYYDKTQGWNRDKIDHVIDLLKKVRLFNRFDDDTLRMMLTKVTLRRLKPNSAIFLKGEEAAIVVSGTLHLLSHELDLACPYITCSYNPGDVIGLDIDNGWSDAQHSWICAWEEVDVFMISDGYLNYMWDTMKRFSSNLIADMLDEAPSMSELSEQTLFTIAHDIAKFREYKDGEVITNQDRDSIYNLMFQQHERAAIIQLQTQDSDQKQLMRKFQADLNPGVGQIWNSYETLKDFERNRQERAKKKQIKGFGSHQEEFANQDQRDTIDGNTKLGGQGLKTTNSIMTQQQQKTMQNMLAIGDQYESQNKRLKQVINTSINKLVSYKKERDALPVDTDGIYIVVRGECRVVNPVDQFKVCKLGKNDNFGASKFIKEQSYSYFGDVVASYSGQGQDKIKKEKHKAENKDSVTTCMFLSKDLLYLIPFYDLHRLRDLNRSDRRIMKVGDNCHKQYKEMIRRWKRSFK